MGLQSRVIGNFAVNSGREVGLGENPTMVAQSAIIATMAGTTWMPDGVETATTAGLDCNLECAALSPSSEFRKNSRLPPGPLMPWLCRRGCQHRYCDKNGRY
jgi:hypothetical protein